MHKWPRRIHPLAGGVAILCIASLMGSTVLADPCGTPHIIFSTKRDILRGLVILVPSLALTGFSGYRATGGALRGLALAKFKRMRVIGANGLCILVPCAFFLAFRASELKFDGVFYSIQSLELVVGSINLALLVMNFRDGVHMARARRV